MFEKKFEDRLTIWNQFRKKLETSTEPLSDTIEFWYLAPSTSRNLDPYDNSTWPDPWQMIEENVYCDFTKLLAVAYTFKLTDRYKDWPLEIKIGVDRKDKKVYYMLVIGNEIICVDYEKSMHITSPLRNIYIEKTYVLSDNY